MGWAQAFQVVAAVSGGIAVVASLASSRISDREASREKAIAERARLDTSEAIAENAALTATANERAALASHEAASTREANLVLQTRLEAERRERLELEAKLRSRDAGVDPAQLAHALAQIGIQTLAVTRLGDLEAGAVADRIIEAARRGRINVGVRQIGIMAPPVYGVQVNGANADAIARVLQGAGLSVQVVGRAGDDHVLVGLKPPAL